MSAVSWPRMRRAVLLGTTGAMFVVLAGATYQGVATSLERRQLPHPGRLIDVGGHQLHLDCVGEGQPTVVLEARALGMSAVWGWVQQDLATRTRVCAYDRSGLGWSEAGDGDYAPSKAVDELHLLLDRSLEARPYILVGHEFGAALATAYAVRYRPELSALILIAAPEVGGGTGPSSSARFADAWPWLARTGILRATNLMARRADGLPDTSAHALHAFLNRPDHLTRAAAELSRWDDTVRLSAAAPLPSDLSILRLEDDNPTGAAVVNNEAEARTISAAITNIIETVRTDR